MAANEPIFSGAGTVDPKQSKKENYFNQADTDINTYNTNVSVKLITTTDTSVLCFQHVLVECSTGKLSLGVHGHILAKYECLDHLHM